MHISLTIMTILSIAAIASIGQAENVRSAPLPDDNNQIFFASGPIITNIVEMSARGLNQAQVPLQLWSGPYWPTYMGVLGARYADPSFPKSSDFITNYNASQDKSADSMVKDGNINLLSPAEKYDLLIGDGNWTLTKSMWQQGLDVNAADGGVATWTGICNGWAAAVSMGIAAPIQSVSTTDVTGKHNIIFYPDDIKALYSYLWAVSSPLTLWAGNRCEEQPISTDPIGRPTNPMCLGSNPMTWHITVTNRIGILGQSFVMDAYPSFQIWNYPVSGYDYSYFNPRTFESSYSLADSTELISNLPDDKFKNTRNPKAQAIVGIMMNVFHPSLVQPQMGASNSKTDEYETYIYDLELDTNGVIVGGEWYSSSSRPAFLWSFPNGSIATTLQDQSLTDTWDISQKLPQSYATSALQASQQDRVLRKIAEALLAKSLSSASP